MTAQFLHTHDPVRYKEEKGYIGLSDFQASNAAPNSLPAGVLDEEERQ